MKTTELVKIPGDYLGMAEDSQTRETHVAIDTCGRPVTAVHLYMVTMIRKVIGREPITTNAFVIAQDEANAICQVEENAFPESDYPYGECRSDKFQATAVRIPFQIRGWGRKTF